jgi:adenylate cyclase
MEGVERRLVVLFAEISGSTKLYERLGDAEALRAVDRCIKRMERAVEGFRGRLVKVVGHEVMAVFDTAEGAYLSALEMQQRIADLPPVSGVKLAIRIAFHVGSATESNGDLAGEAIDAAARIAGLAQAGQILTSLNAAAELPPQLREGLKDLQQSADGTGSVQIFEVRWHKVEDTIPPRAKPEAGKPSAAGRTEAAKQAAAVAMQAVKLCLRYRGRAYLLDEKTPILSLGRDSGSDIVIEDRKASRHHGRIERRENRFFYVDRSTNGSYIAMGGAQEAMVRRAEIVLHGTGSICFGASVNDPSADCATFEYL